ncbi:MAG: hypothetical protein ACO1OT_12870, partial [Heyndrickxia sp.]
MNLKADLNDMASRVSSLSRSDFEAARDRLMESRDRLMEGLGASKENAKFSAREYADTARTAAREAADNARVATREYADSARQGWDTGLERTTGFIRERPLQSLALAVQRYTFYERQLGKKQEEIEAGIPELEELDNEGLSRMRFAMTEPQLALRDIDVEISQDLGASGGKIVSRYESEELAKSGLALNIHRVAKGAQLVAQGFTLVPDPTIHAHYWGIGGSIETMGGKKLAAVAKFGADV